MIAKVVFTSVDDETIVFNNFPFGDNPSEPWHLPLHKFVTDSPVRQSKRTRPQDHGIFKSPPMLGEGTVHMEGDVLYSSGGDTISTIKLMKNIMFGDVSIVPRVNLKLGELNVFLQEDPNDIENVTEYTTPDGCSVDDYSFDISNDNPSVVPFMITFLCYRPYLVNVDNDEDFYIL